MSFTTAAETCMGGKGTELARALFIHTIVKLERACVKVVCAFCINKPEDINIGFTQRMFAEDTVYLQRSDATDYTIIINFSWIKLFSCAIDKCLRVPVNRKPLFGCDEWNLLNFISETQ